MRKQGGALRAVHFANYGYQRVMTNLQTIGNICVFFAKYLKQMPKQYAKSALELLFPIAEMAKHDSEQFFFVPLQLVTKMSMKKIAKTWFLMEINLNFMVENLALLQWMLWKVW